LVAFGADEPSFSEPTKGLKRGFFRCEARSVLVEKKSMGGERTEGDGYIG